MVRVGDLQRGAAGLEDRDPAVGRGERGAFGQAEHVTVEAQGLVVVVGRDDETEFTDGGCVGHGGSSGSRTVN
jgi:hypothetical protein